MAPPAAFELAVEAAGLPLIGGIVTNFVGAITCSPIPAVGSQDSALGDAVINAGDIGSARAR